MQKLFTLFLLAWFIPLNSCRQDKPTAGKKFVAFLNAYQKDSIETMITDDFMVTRNYVFSTQNKEQFINSYVPRQKMLNGKFRITKASAEKDREVFITENSSDYLTWLGAAYPKWKLTVHFTPDNKIDHLSIDSVDSYQKFRKEMAAREKAFIDWLAKKHPDESYQKLYSPDTIWTERLKEYADDRK